MSDSPVGDAFDDAVAVVGLSCRFPDAPTPEEFWENLRSGRESVRSFTADDLRAAGLDPALMSHPNYVNSGVVLEGVDSFDAAFFGLNPRDAEILDPQQRLFLECAWTALEDAGYDPAVHDGPIGVYAGADMSSYLFNVYANPEIVASVGPFAISLANDKDHVTTRVAYKLDLKGPAVTVQTTCSTSLVAICQAAQSLLYFQCDLALAGGTAIALPQGVGYMYQDGGIASPDGHCRAFDASAKGTIGGSGTGVVVLKRYADALADRDNIRAVIRGFAVNNDGSLKVGYTAPSVEGQAEVIAAAQEMAQLDADTITYVEAHGTGTPLGDPIEVAALTQVFRASTDRVGFCGIGSVKTNFGHLNSAAGVASLIKTVLALEHGELPPSLHFERANPNLDLERSPFFVVDRLRPWDANGSPRRAGVSSFGIGGTNAHVVVEEHVPLPESAPSRPWKLVTTSARSEAALARTGADLTRHLRRHPELDVADFAYTLGVGRRSFTHRRALLVRAGDAASVADALDAGAGTAGIATGAHRPVVFLFTGQGSQHVGMGSELYEHEPVFREHVDRAAESLREGLGLDLRDVVFGRTPDGGAQLTQTALAQPALFVLEYALARLWSSWGIEPGLMVGHSIGEFVAACLAGVFELDDALAVVAARGRLMQSMPRGSMLAVPQSEEEVEPLLALGLSLAAVNAPRLCVVSGADEAVAQAEELLRTGGVHSVRLRTSHAFHSQLLDPIVDAFAEELARVELRPPRIPYLSNLTGTWITPEQVTDPLYWARHLRETVRFGRCVEIASDDPERILLELGPGRTLGGLARQQPGRTGRVVLASLPHPNEPASELQTIVGSLGELWIAGAPVDWTGYWAYERRRRVSLPTYPFERRRYWLEPRRVAAEPASTNGARADVANWFCVPAWQRAPAVATNGAGGARRILLLARDDPFGRRVADDLRAGGAKVVLTARESFPEVLRDLKAEDRGPDEIVHARAIGGERPRGANPELAADAFELLALAQAITEELPRRRLVLRVVAERACPSAPGEPVRPDRAMLAGACRVVAQELSNVTTQLIDPGDSPEALTRELLSPADQAVVALRDGGRFVPVFEPRALPPVEDGARLRQRGVYLVTGGLGGIGLAIAHHLAQTVQARLVLVGRTTPSGAKLDVLRELERRGAEVLAVSADVADADRMREVAREVRARFGPLAGIVHAAGVAGGGVIQLKTPETAWQVMAPKVAGAEVLAEVFGDDPLDFVVLCSSLAAQLGGFGQLDYSAANCYLDAFAHDNVFRRRGVPVTSIDWDTWSEVGMAVETQVPEELQRMRAEGLWRGIRTSEGVDAFRRILAAAVPQIAVSTTDLGSRLRAASAAAAADVPPPTIPATPAHAALHDRPELATPYVAPRNDVETVIAKIWEELLGVARIGVDDNFLDLGGHSLLAIQLISRIRDALDEEISVQRFFEQPTVAALARLAGGPVDGDSGARTAEPVPGRAPATATPEPLPRERFRVRLGEGTMELPEALREWKARVEGHESP